MSPSIDAVLARPNTIELGNLPDDSMSASQASIENPALALSHTIDPVDHEAAVAKNL